MGIATIWDPGNGGSYMGDNGWSWRSDLTAWMYDGTLTISAELSKLLSEPTRERWAGGDKTPAGVSMPEGCMWGLLFNTEK